MLNRKRHIIFAFLLSVGVIISPAYAKKSKVNGDPKDVWLSPLGTDNIENNAYNRCTFIKTLKPGLGQATTTTQNTYDTFSTYAANLYAQSIKISDYLDEEKSQEESNSDLSNEKALLDEEILARLGDISRRINIINYFESWTMLLESLEGII